MYNPKSPPEKIQALFYKALEPAAKAMGQPIKPSDISVVVAPIVDPTSREKKHNIHKVSIDFSKTPLVPFIRDMRFGFSNTASFVEPAAIQFRDDLSETGHASVLGYDVSALQQEIAGALEDCGAQGAQPVIEALQAAVRRGSIAR